MKNLQMYCLSLQPDHLEMIQKFGYTPVGLGDEQFNKEWLSDKKKNNISKKNKHYGEYTFHYCLWKNNVINHNKWIGFCQYRKFWVKPNSVIRDNDFSCLNNSVLKNIPSKLKNYETILGENFLLNQFRFMKFIKRNFKTMLFKPELWVNKKKRNIKFHFDMWHGHGNLDKAIKLLEHEERKDFNDFVNTDVSFSPHNMFICKSKKILFKYYESVFPWLARCEKIYGLRDLHGYGLRRIYGFLAERYMSYWFKKYTKFKILKIHFKDISEYI